METLYPAADDVLNRELVNLLVYLKSPAVIAKTVALMRQGGELIDQGAPGLLSRNLVYGPPIAQMLANRPDAQKVHYAFALRNLRDGWTLDERLFYFQWLRDAQKWSGGRSYQGFIKNIEKDAFENASEAERLAIESSGVRQRFRLKDLPRPQAPAAPGRWTICSGSKIPGRGAAATSSADKRCSPRRGAFSVTAWAAMGERAVPISLNLPAGSPSGTFARRSSIPSKVVSDLYVASVVATGSASHTGRIVNETKSTLSILVDPEDSTKVVVVPKTEVDERKPSKTSLMPERLLDALNEDEVLDLLAYLLCAVT